MFESVLLVLSLTCHACPQLTDDEFELEDINTILEAMDISVSPDDEAATAWAASELDVSALKQSLSSIEEDRQEEALAKEAQWREAFGAEAEVTDIVDAEAAGSSADGFDEIVTF